LEPAPPRRRQSGIEGKPICVTMRSMISVCSVVCSLTIRRHAQRKRRAAEAAPRSLEQTAGSCRARALVARGDRVESRVRNLVILNLGRSFNHLRETLPYFGLGVASIGVRVR